MPFGPLLQPSIGLSLLKAAIPARSTYVRYATLEFADLIGADLYAWIAERSAATALVGEWLFAPALFGTDASETAEYEARVIATEEHVEPVTSEMLAELRSARALASGFIDRLADEIQRLNPRIVGFSNVFAQQVPSLALAQRVKRLLPGTAVVVGGANCEAPMGRTIAARFPFVDAVVSGEGELVFPALVERLLAAERCSDLPGVYTREATPPSAHATRVEHLDALPFPDYSDFFDQWERSTIASARNPVVLFETSRGCWWGQRQHCTFCGLNGSSMTFRSKSASRTLAEIEALAERHPGLFMMSVDNILDHRYFRDLIPELARRASGHRLFFAMKANLKKEQLRLLRDAGIRTIQPGIESLSDTILKHMRKGETALENIQLLKWCAELELKPAWNFIWGFPGEPEAEYARMAALVPLLTHLKPPQTAKSIRLDRYSPLFMQPEQFGLRHVRPTDAYRFVYPFDDETLSELAYHFAFEADGSRHAHSYTEPLASAIAGWQHDHDTSALTCEDRGDELWIWDLRACANDALVILDGPARDVYLACDSIKSLPRLAANAGSGIDLESIVGPLLNAGLMLRDGDRLLSLAVLRGHGNGRH